MEELRGRVCWLEAKVFGSLEVWVWWGLDEFWVWGFCDLVTPVVRYPGLGGAALLKFWPEKQACLAFLQGLLRVTW